MQGKDNLIPKNMPAQLTNNISPLEAFYERKKQNPAITISYFVKNYLILLNTINSTLTPSKVRFSRKRDLEDTFSLGYYEDLSNRKVYYLEGIKGSQYMNIIELEKNGSRYDLFNIIVNRDNSQQLKIKDFFEFLQEVTVELSEKYFH